MKGKRATTELLNHPSPLTELLHLLMERPDSSVWRESSYELHFEGQ